MLHDGPGDECAAPGDLIATVAQFAAHGIEVFADARIAGLAVIGIFFDLHQPGCYGAGILCSFGRQRDLAAFKRGHHGEILHEHEPGLGRTAAHLAGYGAQVCFELEIGCIARNRDDGAGRACRAEQDRAECLRQGTAGTTTRVPRLVG